MEADVAGGHRGASLVMLDARGAQRVGQGPVLALGGLGLGGAVQALVGHNVEKHFVRRLALPMRLDHEAGRRVDELLVAGHLVVGLQLADVGLLLRAVLRVADLVHVVGQQLAELVLLEGVLEARHLLGRHVQLVILLQRAGKGVLELRHAC
eukprot:scaffold2584_cov231-Pinguiococcus_pyrenoidosus.AAC.2